MDDDQSEEYPAPPTDVPAVDPATLAERLQRGDDLSLLDVRDRDEFEEWHVDGPSVEAVQIPYVRFVQAEITDTVDDLAGDLADPVLVVCGRGEASAYVAGLLREVGVDAQNLAGGMEAWARVYRATEVDHDGPATVVQYDRPSSGCLSYLVHDGDRGVVVDPLRAFADRYVADAEEAGVTIEYAVDTHVHADHVSGIRTLAGLADATPVLPENARQRGLSFDAETVADGDVLAVGGLTLSVVATPGHTTELVSYRVDDVLVCGDTLFMDSVARPDLEAGDEGAPDLARTLYGSLHERVLALPDQTVVAPGHHDTGDPLAADGTYTATVGTLRDRVGVLSLDEDAFVERITGRMPPQPANFERIIATNLGTEAVDDDEAFELELGPNNCAATAD